METAKNAYNFLYLYLYMRGMYVTFRLYYIRQVDTTIGNIKLKT